MIALFVKFGIMLSAMWSSLSALVVIAMRKRVQLEWQKTGTQGSTREKKKEEVKSSGESRGQTCTSPSSCGTGSRGPKGSMVKSEPSRGPQSGQSKLGMPKQEGRATLSPRGVRCSCL